MRHFPKEKIFRKFQVFFQKNVSRFLSLRYTADFRRSRLVSYYSVPGSRYRIRANTPNYIFYFNFDALPEDKYTFKCAIANLEIDRSYGFIEEDLLTQEVCYPQKSSLFTLIDQFISSGMFTSPNGRFVLNLEHLKEEGIFVYDNALSRKVSWTTGWNYTGLLLGKVSLYVIRVSNQLFLFYTNIEQKRI